ncbi:MAG: SDR family oxidoreductase [Candidatus Kapabacteria bacterium]|nr:SDR family oxidoreductase [Candidatus Kapabacteria bacterium]MDW8224938.1 SDR family oxidoreductase [Bacteroidota bacterium]
MQIHRFEQGLQGRIALVTGAAIGNGRAFCERLAEEGALIAIADIADARQTAEAVRRLGGEVLTIQADLTKPADVDHVVHSIRSRWGGVDILVHNVGLYEEEPFELLTFEQWQRMLDVTLNSLFLMVKAVLPSMKERGFGRIIALSSDTVWLGTPYLVHYVTAKMGIVGFVRSLAAEVGRYGITVNAITVGLTATQRPHAAPLSQTILQHILPSQAVHRADEPEDIANVVAFLALPASGIITGQTINVDGGVARH